MSHRDLFVPSLGIVIHFGSSTPAAKKLFVFMTQADRNVLQDDEPCGDWPKTENVDSPFPVSRSRTSDVEEMDVILAMQEGCSSLVFERFLERLQISTIICEDFKQLPHLLQKEQRRNLRKALVVIVDEPTWLVELQQLPPQGRVPLFIDTCVTKKQSRHVRVLASCSFAEFQEAFQTTVSWWKHFFVAPDCEVGPAPGELPREIDARRGATLGGQCPNVPTSADCRVHRPL